MDVQRHAVQAAFRIGRRHALGHDHRQLGFAAARGEFGWYEYLQGEPAFAQRGWTHQDLERVGL